MSPRWRVTIDVEAESYGDAVLDVYEPSGGHQKLVGCDRLTTGVETAVRSVTFYRRADVGKDTPGDFLPMTQPCEGTVYDRNVDITHTGPCPEIASMLVQWSDGEEWRACEDHFTDWTGLAEVKREQGES